MKTRNIVSQSAIEALADEGLGQTEIARRLGCSRQTVWRKLRGYEPNVTPPAASNGAPSTGDLDALDWPALQVEAVDILRTSAKRGSATSAVQLARLASAEARADSCINHVEEAMGAEAMTAFWETLGHHLLGPFARRVSVEFEIEPAIVEEAILAGLDDVARELDARQECREITEEQRAASR